jgi:dTMP kinase
MKSAKTGKFIVLEGIDGAGKDVQAKQIARYLKKKGCKVVITKEYRKHSAIGKKITKLVKTEKDPRKKAAQYYKLFLQDRREHIKELITPSLARGKIVVCIRYKYSTIVYQEAQGMSSKKTISDQKSFPIPDLTLILDLDAGIALKRLAKRSKERTVFENKEFLKKIRKNFLALKKKLKKDNLVIIDASKSIEGVFKEIKKHVDSIL